MRQSICTLFLMYMLGLQVLQAQIPCDSLVAMYNRQWDNLLFKKITNKNTLKALNKCILRKRKNIVNNKEFVGNISSLKSALIEESLREKATLLTIKMHKLLSPPLKNMNEQGLLSTLRPSDLNFGRPKFLNKIKRNFGNITYYKVLQILNIKLIRKENGLLAKSFNKIEDKEQFEWKTERWFAAIVLARAEDSNAEDYLIEETKQATNTKENRPQIYDLGRDLIFTKNRKIFNFIIDDFLMSDYSWSDFDTSYSDYYAAFDLLGLVVDEPVFDNSLKMKNGKDFLRQWFKDHRETYKIKP